MSAKIESLTTKRLLAYYKAERKRMISFKNRYTCECCGEADWDLKPNDKDAKIHKQKHLSNQQNLLEIKEILDTREHVKINKK